ncbi:MAG: glucose-6-phosphate isomerase [Candidatus Gracilibacteria bacterium]|nr:glucose-6-phosphate isomerase [Candidatus Gracilibacteria bacterium]
MPKFIKVELDLVNINQNDIIKLQPQIISQDKSLLEKTGAGNDFLGWIDVEKIISKEELKEIIETGKYLKQNFEKIVVIGIGGSYLGAKAYINALKNNFDEEQIIFAGYNLDGEYLKDLLKFLENKNYAIIIISKSGTTLEPALTFRMLLEQLNKKYSNDEVSKRVIAITDAKKGVLKELSIKKSFKTFKISDDVGGRYSVLTPVGLLPIATAGYDIEKMIDGAKDMKKYIDENYDIFSNPAYIYAGTRNILLQNGKSIEILASFDLKLKFIAEWWKQLFGESEGKDGKGIFPTNLDFTTDLHSMGQYVQQGARNIFETIFIVENDNVNLKIPFIENDDDKLNFVFGKTFDFVNKSALNGTIKAHKEGMIDIIKIIIPEISEYYLGQLIYFFERACSISAYMLGVNPFNQPGVEAYKKYMMTNIKN